MASAFLGLLFTTSFAPLSFWFVGLFALAVWFYLLTASASYKQSAYLGLCFGVAHFSTSLYWLYHSFYVTLGNYYLGVLAGGLAVLAIAVIFSLLLVLLALAVRKLSFMPSALMAVFFVLGWVLVEFIRSNFVPTFAWNLAGYAWADTPAFIQVAAHVGVYGLSALFVFVAACLSRGSRVLTCVALTLLALLYAYGSFVLVGHKPVDVQTADAYKLSVDVTRGEASQFDKWTNKGRREYLGRFLSLADAANAPDVTLWPETSITTLLENDERLRLFVMEKLGGGSWVVGAPRLDGKGLYYNSAFVVDEKAQLAGVYDKRFLVPFGEYFPLRSVFPQLFEMFLQGQGDYTPGVLNQNVFEFKGKRFAPLVCGEIVLPHISRYVSADADYILNMTNDAWFEGTVAPSQLLAISKVQAVVLGKPLLRVSNMGQSAFIDEFGRVLKVSSKNERSGFSSFRLYL